MAKNIDVEDAKCCQVCDVSFSRIAALSSTRSRSSCAEHPSPCQDYDGGKAYRMIREGIIKNEHSLGNMTEKLQVIVTRILTKLIKASYFCSTSLLTPFNTFACMRSLLRSLT